VVGTSSRPTVNKRGGSFTTDEFFRSADEEEEEDDAGPLLARVSGLLSPVEPNLEWTFGRPDLESGAPSGDSCLDSQS